MRSPLPYVPAAARADAVAHPLMQEGAGLFEIRDAPWQLTSIEKLASHERSDSAFRLLYPVDSGLLMFDDLGHARGFGPIQSTALRYNRAGELVAKAGFARDIYRLDVHPLRPGLLSPCMLIVSCTPTMRA